MTTKDHNVKELEKQIAEAAARISELKKDRAAINQDIAAVIETLEANGINRHAFRFALRYWESNETTREGFDIGYELARQALGVPLQGDLFDIEKVKTRKQGGDNAPTDQQDIEESIDAE